MALNPFITNWHIDLSMQEIAQKMHWKKCRLCHQSCLGGYADKSACPGQNRICEAFQVDYPNALIYLATLKLAQNLKRYERKR